MTRWLWRIANELLGEWEFVVYLVLTFYVSLVYARDRRAERREFRDALTELERKIDLHFVDLRNTSSLNPGELNSNHVAALEDSPVRGRRISALRH